MKVKRIELNTIEEIVRKTHKRYKHPLGSEVQEWMVEYIIDNLIKGYSEEKFAYDNNYKDDVAESIGRVYPELRHAALVYVGWAKE